MIETIIILCGIVFILCCKLFIANKELKIRRDAMAKQDELIAEYRIAHKKYNALLNESRKQIMEMLGEEVEEETHTLH